MKPIANNVALLISFSLCLSFLPLLNAAGKNTLVAETCQKAKYKDLCISSLEAEHAGQDANQNADLAALALIAVKVASNNGSDTSVYIKKLLDGTNWNLQSSRTSKIVQKITYPQYSSLMIPWHP
ncbi:hypothetical protein CRYUN_Cryun14cG0084400 [Craigia yunnanensis]